MAEKIPEHSHCHMCGKSIVFGETLCSDECRQKYQKLLKRRKLMLYFMYGMLVALVLVFVVYGRV